MTMFMYFLKGNSKTIEQSTQKYDAQGQRAKGHIPFKTSAYKRTKIVSFRVYILLFSKEH